MSDRANADARMHTQLHVDDHARAIAAALPSPAGAIVLARANAALSELVRFISLVERRTRACSPDNAEVEFEDDQGERRHRIA